MGSWVSVWDAPVVGHAWHEHHEGLVEIPAGDVLVYNWMARNDIGLLSIIEVEACGHVELFEGFRRKLRGLGLNDRCQIPNGEQNTRNVRLDNFKLQLACPRCALIGSMTRTPTQIQMWPLPGRAAPPYCHCGLPSLLSHYHHGHIGISLYKQDKSSLSAHLKTVNTRVPDASARVSITGSLSK